MTWDQFKAAVDAKLQALGADGSIEIWYIDMDGFEAECEDDPAGGLQVEIAKGPVGGGELKVST